MNDTIANVASTLEEAAPGATVVLGTDARARNDLAKKWQEPGREPDDAPVPAERPDLTVSLEVSRTSIPFRCTYDEAFGLIRGLYAREGREGPSAFFRANQMVRRTVRGKEGVEVTEPDDFLSADRAIAYRLLSAARRRVDQIAKDRVDLLEPLLAAEALSRLAAAHEQIQAGARYFQRPRPVEATVFDDRISTYVFVLANTKETAAMLAELRRCRDLLTQAEAAGRRLQKARERAVSDALRDVGPFAFVTPAPAGMSVPAETPGTRAVAKAVAADPVVVERSSEEQAARAALQEQLTLAGLEHPPLFRIYRDADPADVGAVGRTIVNALRSADAANHRLQTELRDNADVVWQFPATVREGLAELGVPEMSVAWVACEERVAEEQGPRLAAQLGMVSGLAVGGVALLGAAVAPPLAIAIAIADVVVNLIDALQEYLSYRRLRAGFDAVLDPSMALGAEPGLLGTVLTIAFDLASAIPIPGGKAAAAAVP